MRSLPPLPPRRLSTDDGTNDAVPGLIGSETTLDGHAAHRRQEMAQNAERFRIGMSRLPPLKPRGVSPAVRYALIYADPGWEYAQGGRGAINDRYTQSGPEAIHGLDVPSIAADDAVLFLWGTWPQLPIVMATFPAWGFCVSPETRVLTDDLRWLPAEQLGVGQELLAFDENPRPDKGLGRTQRRYFDRGHVTSSGIERMESYEVRLADGTRLRCSAEHPWLVRDVMRDSPTRRQTLTRWMRARDMATTLKNHRRKWALMMPRLAPVTSPRTDYIGGFLAAAFDGEGCIRKQGGRGPGLGFAQNQNAFLRQTFDYLNKADYTFGVYNSPQRTNLHHVNLRAGVAQTIRFLSEMRPPRLLENWRKLDLRGASLYNTDQDEVEVVEVVPIGKQWMCTLSTSTQTYIAEGFGAHNTYKTCAFVWVKHHKSKPCKTCKGNGFVVIGQIAAWCAPCHGSGSIEGKRRVGGGFWTRANTEFCLIGVRGKNHPTRVNKAIRQLIETDEEDKQLIAPCPTYPNGKVIHSAKPPEARERIVRLMGELPRIELYARERVDGWAAWGDDKKIGKPDVELGVRK